MPDVFVSSSPPPSTGPTNGASTTNGTQSSSLLSLHSGPVGIFSSFCLNPTNISFQTQRSNETILLFLRAHFITNVPWIVLTVILAFVPPLLSLFGFSATTLFSFFTPVYTSIAIAFYYLLLVSYAYVSFITWFFNVFIVTVERIIDIDYSDIIYRNVAETKLSNVEEVNFTKTGFIRSLFNYGNVFVQTAAEMPNFDALSIPRPEEATTLIGQLIGRGQTR